jgi:hypothetical protein
MSIFRTRSPQRDRDTDKRRLVRLTALLRTFLREMTAERAGFEARLRKTEEEAAFSMLAFEDGEGGRISARVDELTATIVAASNRLKSLQDQIAFVSRLLDEAIAFGEAYAPHRQETINRVVFRDPHRTL